MPPEDDPDRPDHLDALIERCQRTGDLADVNAALDAAADAVTATGPTDLALAGRLSKLAVVLSLRFEITGRAEDLDRSVTLQREAVSKVSADSPDAGTMLSNLAATLVLRFHDSGQRADLDDAIDAGRQAVGHLPEDHPDRPSALHNLATCLLDRGESAEDLADLDEAVAASRSAVEQLPAGHADLPAIASGLGNALLTRYEYAPNAADLDDATELLADVLARAPADDPDYAGWLSNYANARLHQFSRSGSVQDADDAIAGYLRALDRTPPTSPYQVDRLDNLAAGYRLRAERTGDVGDVNRAIAVGEELLALVPDTHPRYRAVLAGLGHALMLRSDWTGSMADADLAVAAAEQAVAALGSANSGSADRADRLADLAKALLTRFDRTGSMADADRAVAVAEQAADLVSEHPDRIEFAARSTDLANALLARGRRTGSSADGAQAIDLIRTAISAIPPVHYSYPGRLINLAYILLERADRADPAADNDDEADPIALLAEAVSASGEGMRLTPSSHHEWWIAAAAHGNALLAKFQLTRDSADLDASIEAYQQVVAATSASHPDRAGQLGNLGNALHLRYEMTGDHNDLVLAVDQLRMAVRASEANHADTAIRQLGLGQTLMELVQPGTAEILAEAISNLRSAASNTAARPALRIDAARTWGQAAARAQAWDLAVAGYSAAIALLPITAWHGLSRDDQESQLTSRQDLARDAAACALQAGHPELAVELLEQGRSVIWGQMLQIRTDITDLAASHPELSAQLTSIRGLLDTAGGATFASADADADQPVQAGAHDVRRRNSEQRMSAAREWDALLEEVQALPGFAGFCQPVSFSQLTDAAAGGPVVIVNVSRIRCDALIITRSGLRVLPLDQLTWDGVMTHGDAYLHAIQRLTGDAADDLDGVDLQSGLDAIDATLGWLWNAVAEPVLTVLGYTQVPADDATWPRVWWSATGPLSLLPIHAAGHYERGSSPAPASVMDRVVSSYTPTLSALSRARSGSNNDGGGRSNGPGRSTNRSSCDDGSAQRRLLIVAMPTGAELPDLAGARREADWLAARFPGSHSRRDDADARVDEIVRQIPQHAIAHFSCHGSQDLTHPSQGGLLLDDGVLSVPQVAALDLSRAELAFLSACQTAIGGVRLPDESIHLSAAFQLAGYRHVIGTLWAVADRDSAEVVAEIYQALSGGTGQSLDDLELERTAAALHQAVRRLRDRRRALSLRWIPYIHIGP